MDMGLTPESGGGGDKMKNTVTTVSPAGRRCASHPLPVRPSPGRRSAWCEPHRATPPSTRGETSLPADPGLKVVVGHPASPVGDGSLGVILRDDSSLSIGPGSRLVLSSSNSHLARESLDLVAPNLPRDVGVLSGLIGKAWPAEARARTPAIRPPFGIRR